jgi:hypothetical protein
MPGHDGGGVGAQAMRVRAASRQIELLENAPLLAEQRDAVKEYIHITGNPVMKPRGCSVARHKGPRPKGTL